MNDVTTNPDEFIWAQKYRPKLIKDTILPAGTKAAFMKFVENKNIPNLLLCGPHGMGKTTAAIAMLEELKCDYIKINGSLSGGIDTLRYDIANFASTVSIFSEGRKYVIIDEADNLTTAMQSGLRSFMEEFSKNCGFIFTCNYKSKIIGPLRESRFTIIDYDITPAEKPKLAAQFFKRVVKILEVENVEYDQATVAQVVQKFFPDFRRTLNELQRYSSIGPINEGIFAAAKDENLDSLFDMLKNKKFTDMRKWVSQNMDRDVSELFRAMYDVALEKIELKSMPGFIIMMAEYQFKHSMVADPEINFMAFLSEIMVECSFK